MNNLLIRNFGPLVFISLTVGIGYCFGGKIGVGIALTIVLLCQIL